MQDHPPELKGFHKRNMKHVLLVTIVPVAAGILGFYRQEVYSAKDALQDVLSWIFMIGVGVFVITILIKAIITIPKCPKCQRKMRQLETIDITDETFLSFKTSSRWRIVECPHCNQRFRIPGLSNG